MTQHSPVRGRFRLHAAAWAAAVLTATSGLTFGACGTPSDEGAPDAQASQASPDGRGNGNGGNNKDGDKDGPWLVRWITDLGPGGPGGGEDYGWIAYEQLQERDCAESLDSAGGIDDELRKQIYAGASHACLAVLGDKRRWERAEDALAARRPGCGAEPRLDDALTIRSGLPRSSRGRPAVGSVQDVYRAMLRDRVAPELRALGFKGSGVKYRLDDEECWAGLGFQASVYNTSQTMRFTINLCVVSRLVWESARSERPYLPTSPSPSTYYGTFVWQRRIGQLMPSKDDLWWDLDRRTKPDAVADAVVTAVRDFGLPAMRQQLR